MADQTFAERSLGVARNLLGLRPASPRPPTLYEDAIQLYQLQYDYYLNNGLYDQITRGLVELGVSTEGMKSLRNPAYRIVEAYVDNVWDGELDEVFAFAQGNRELQEACHQIWAWSNWDRAREVVIRHYPIFGDLFLKIAQPDGTKRVEIQRIDPRLVTEFRTDTRGYLTWIRLDEMLSPPDELDFAGFPQVRTEVWDKVTQTMRIWVHEHWEYRLEDLGEPTDEANFAEFGINFVPFVYEPFKDVGERRGVGAFTILKDKIDEANRAATRLHEILFRYNKPLLAVLSGGNDQSGRPLPPVQIAGRQTSSAPGTMIGDEDVAYFPGSSRPELLVPDIHYGEALAILNAQIKELELDAPELTLYRLPDLGDDLSSRSAQLMLAPAIKRIVRARRGAETALIRADQMAISIAQAQGIFPRDLGSYEKGDLDHRFKPRPVIPVSRNEEAESDQKQGQAATYWIQVGIKEEAVAERLGFKRGDLKSPEELAALRRPPMANPQNTPNPPPEPGMEP